MVGRTLAQYRIEEKLGQGGMGDRTFHVLSRADSWEEQPKLRHGNVNESSR